MNARDPWGDNYPYREVHRPDGEEPPAGWPGIAAAGAVVWGVILVGVWVVGAWRGWWS